MTKEESISKMKKDIEKDIAEIKDYLKQMETIRDILYDDNLKDEEKLLKTFVIAILKADSDEIFDLIQNKKRSDKNEISPIE